MWLPLLIRTRNIVKWFPTYWFKTPLKLTVARRKRFNDLVVKINQAISDVIDEVQDDVKYTIGKDLP